MHEASVSGIVDWSWAGVGDPYDDLAIVTRSIARNFGAELVPRFFDAYGIEVPDEERLAFYRLVSELF